VIQYRIDCSKVISVNSETANPIMVLKTPTNRYELEHHSNPYTTSCPYIWYLAVQPLTSEGG
jgi:hypothetical protein